MPTIRQPTAPTRHQTLSRGGSIDRHRHVDHQLVYASRGLLAVTTVAGAWIAPATRAIWVPSGVDHEHAAHGKVELHLIGVPQGLDPLGVDEPVTLSVSPLLRELITEYAGTLSATGPQRERLRAVLLDQLATAPQLTGALPVPTSPLLTAIAASFHADPADGRTLKEFGLQVGASERTLSRAFRADLGMTFPQWRTRLRLHLSLTLLADGLPVNVVAHRCGWATSSTFIDAFRETFGYTPGRRLR
jgi:AraC-like DNA-binding protein/quercetin dioxygenase-like cupin family protein